MARIAAAVNGRVDEVDAATDIFLRQRVDQTPHLQRPGRTQQILREFQADAFIGIGDDLIEQTDAVADAPRALPRDQFKRGRLNRQALASRDGC